MIESHFGESPALSLGVEEELMIVDAASYDQRPEVRTLLAEAGERGLPGLLKTELFASVVESNTAVSVSAHEAAERLRVLRRGAGEAAAVHGLAIVAAGSHPFSNPEDQRIADEPRYEEFVAYAGVSARRQGVQGLHVHVGMPDGDSCLRVLETILPWLPVVLAISANSPYLTARETGLASNRAEILAQLPRSGAPPRLETYRDWERFVERLIGMGLIKDYTTLWWDVRPHPRFGTLEIRMPDQPTAVDRSAGFVALLQALCGAALDQGAHGDEPGDRALYQQNRWAASRFGPSAELVHPDGGRLAPACDLLTELLDRIGPVVDRLGTGDLVASLDRDGSEGERQLEIGREHGLVAVCADLVTRSLASP